MGLFDDITDAMSTPEGVILTGGTGLMVGGLTGKGVGGDLVKGIGGMFNPKSHVASGYLERPIGLQDQQAAADRTAIALQQQQNFLNALYQQPGGFLGQGNIFNQQQALANQLQQQTLGQGPNPAMAQLAQQTAANTANQAALMAGQRGSRANAGMIARQAGQRGAANQQQMIGQAATMQAQQQIAAQQQLAQQQAAMANLATNQVSQQQAGLGQFIGGAQNQQQMMLNAIANQNANQLNQAGMQNQMNMANQQAQNRMLGSLLNVGGAVAGGMFGGPAGAAVGSQAGNIITSGMGGASSSGMESPQFYNVAAQGGMAGTNQMQKAPMTSKAAAYFKNALQLKDGGNVPGKASVSGNSLQNDKVPAMLSPGEIVIPRSITQGANAPDKAAAFVAACLAKRGK